MNRDAINRCRIHAVNGYGMVGNIILNDWRDLLDAYDAAMAVVEAAKDCDNAHRHVGICAVMHDTRGCSCGHEALRKSLDAMGGA